jgi:hypothetical protein
MENDLLIILLFDNIEFGRNKMSNTRNVAILVFDDVEILDFAGPYGYSTLPATQPIRLRSMSTM